jgi:hypothetical protein
MLGRAWRTLRRLDRTQLQNLARQAGLEKVEGYLERVARDKGRLSPTALGQILERLEQIEPGEVHDVVHGLRDPGKRKTLFRKGLDAMDDLLGEDEGEDDRPAASTVVPEPVAVEPPPTPPVAVPEPEPEVEPERSPVVEEAARPAPPPAPPPPSPAVKRAAPAPRPPEPVEPTTIPASGPPHSAPSIEREPVSGAAGPEPAGAPEPVARGERDPDDLVGRLEAESSVMDRLRIVRRELEELDPSDVDGLRRLLETFPDGWARRRALDAMLRAGRPATLMHAVYLIEQLESPAARRWCAGTLLDTRDLSDAERNTLVERHGLFPHRRSARG